MTRAFLGMGSNLGDRRAHLSDAVSTLGDMVVAVSDVYETAPVGGPRQSHFLNIVVEVDSDLAPHDLLRVCWRLEAAAGRVRETRWGPRTLDVDVLWIDGVTMDDDDLTIPHPRMWERRFVLAPLSELAPELLPDDWEAQSDGMVRRVGALH